jgi:hypothetical protein
MNPSDPTITTPKKLIFSINDNSSEDGFVVTWKRRFVESINSLRFNTWILLGFCDFLGWLAEMKTLLF